jgi:hypothetical protein
MPQASPPKGGELMAKFLVNVLAAIVAGVIVGLIMRFLNA